MKRLLQIAVIAISVFLVSGQGAFALEGPKGVGTGETKLGTVLVDPDGLTLYTFDNDDKEKSNCYGKCEKLWPIFLAPKDARPIGDFTPFTRDDGYNQWSYKGRPLYTWAKDKAPGDVTGQGFRGTWYVATPAGSDKKATSGSSSGTSGSDGSYTY